MSNIEQVFLSANQAEVNSGMNWYNAAHRFAANLSDKYNVPLTTTCAVIAALSPNCAWSVNCRDAEKLIRAFKRNPNTVRRQSLATWPNNKKKAIKMLRTNDVTLLNPKTGPKTYAFYHNILNPFSAEHVCIDRHAFGIYEGKRFEPTKVPKLTPTRYSTVSNAYRTVAEKHNMLPNQVQAIAWVRWHRKEE